MTTDTVTPSILSLFTGYGGLDLAVTALTGGELVGVSDIDPGPCKLLAARHPDVPNIGDVKAVDWHDDSVPHFDVLCGGYPCQPFSAAGRRAGTDDPRHLWPDVLRAIEARRPRQVFLENVRGHLTLGFDVVLRDFIAAGYSVRWSICAASSVGAPHRRERLYIYATPDEGSTADAVEKVVAALDALPKTKKGNPKVPTAGSVTAGELTTADRVDAPVMKSSTSILLPTPVARDGKGRTSMNREGGPGLADLGRLLPTPKAGDSIMGRPRTSGRPIDRSTHLPTIATLMPGIAGDSTMTDYGDLLPTPRASDDTGSRTEPRPGGKLLPTPNASDMTGGGQHPSKREGHSRQVIDEVLGLPGVEKLLPTPDTNPGGGGQLTAAQRREQGRTVSVYNALVGCADESSVFGDYAPAVRRWEGVTGRTAPAPTEVSTTGRTRLAAEFAEWMMGLPAGWITGEDLGLPHTVSLKLAGNGVVPQAAYTTYSFLIDEQVAVEDDGDRPSGWSPFNVEAWGPYTGAIARWSLILGRDAPAPVAPNRNGRPALTAEFAEWMMGLPAGWITGEDLGLSRSNCLKLAGNGVVPQAAHFAYSALLADN